jgi:translation initiation factor 1 (eIF-1/SUI1)
LSKKVNKTQVRLVYSTCSGKKRVTVITGLDSLYNDLKKM